MEQSVNHDELDAALKRCGATWDAGQAHGLLCSRLAILGTDAGIGWLDQVLEGSNPDDALRRECESMLDALYAFTHRQLAERQSEFEPLLPDDSDSTMVRADAIARWCEGFLHGLVSGAPDERLKERLASDPLSDIIKDMLQDSMMPGRMSSMSSMGKASSASNSSTAPLGPAREPSHSSLSESRSRQNRTYSPLSRPGAKTATASGSAKPVR